MKLPLVMWSVLVGAVMLGVASPAPAQEKSQPYWVYIGTFTDHGAKGIYLMQFDAASGSLSEPQLAAQLPSPSFHALSADHRFLYSTNEVSNIAGSHEGGVTAFSLDAKTGKLTLLNQQPSAGQGPTHISLDHTGKDLFVANYNNGSVAVLPIGPDGKLQPPSSTDQHKGKGGDPSRQDGPHAHCFNVDPQNRFALSCDLGLDKVFVYRFAPAKGQITPNDPPFATVAPASGPRHLVFHPNGKWVYVTNEMSCTVTAFNYDAEHGTLSEFQTISTLPADFSGMKSTAEITVHPNGNFLYVSNRDASNTIASFKIDPQTGKLEFLKRVSTQGSGPRHFAIDPTGDWLLAGNQNTNNVVVYRLNPQTGDLTPTGTNIKVPTPVCVTFVPVEK